MVEHDAKVAAKKSAEQLITTTAKDGGSVAASENFGAGAIIDHLDIWTSAIEQKSASGRGSSKKFSLHGIKKLRELILELAVRGKLVPQDPTDEPASVLLARIAAEKAQLVKDKKIKKPKALPEISEDEKPFELPKGWEWVRLQDISSYIQRGKGPSYAEEGTVRVISQKCVQNTGFDISPARFVTDDSLEKYQAERFLINNDILWNSTGTGTVGRANVITNIEEKSLVADSHVTVIRPTLVYSRFIWCFIMAPGIQSRIEPDHENALVSGSTKQVELNTSSVITVVTSLPPLEEQHRIVAKVDELMSLCDALEAQTEASITAHQTLVETLLGALLLPSANANSPEQVESPKRSVEKDSEHSFDNSLEPSFAESWQRVAEHFDTLFTTSASIDTLKQTILQLAVMGKLVEQASCEARNSANYEPAAKLLERIEEEKAQLIADKKIKKQKPLTAITDEEKPFELPKGWEWGKLNSLITIMDAGWSPACPPEASPNNDVWGVLKTTAVQNMEYREYENKVLSESKEPRPQYEVKVGDILITRAGPKNRVGVSCLVQETRPKLMISDKIIRFHLVEVGMSERFISLCLNAGPTAEFLETAKSGMAESQMNISQDKLKAAPIPLAPLEEQHRIVAKVDELMALCDQLKARLSDAQTTQLHLTDAIVEQAV